MKKVSANAQLYCAVLFILLSMLITACGGSTSSDIDTDIKDAETNRSSTFKFVNATDEMTTFYAKYKGISESIYSSEYELVSVLEKQTSEAIIYKWNDKLSDTEFAVIDSVSQSKKNKTSHTISDDQSYVAVAWQDNDETTLTVIGVVNNANVNAYAVRFFSEIDQQVTFGDSESFSVTAEKGEVTNVVEIDSCAALEAVNDQQTNFCQMANLGESYLFVITADGEVVFTQE